MKKDDIAEAIHLYQIAEEAQKQLLTHCRTMGRKYAPLKPGTPVLVKRAVLKRRYIVLGAEYDPVSGDFTYRLQESKGGRVIQEGAHNVKKSLV